MLVGEARVGAQQARSFAANGAASVRRPPADFKHAEQLGFLMFCWNIFLFNGNVGFLRTLCHAVGESGGANL